MLLQQKRHRCKVVSRVRTWISPPSVPSDMSAQSCTGPLTCVEIPAQPACAHSNVAQAVCRLRVCCRQLQQQRQLVPADHAARAAISEAHRGRPKVGQAQQPAQAGGQQPRPPLQRRHVDKNTQRGAACCVALHAPQARCSVHGLRHKAAVNRNRELGARAQQAQCLLHFRAGAAAPGPSSGGEGSQPSHARTQLHA